MYTMNPIEKKLVNILQLELPMVQRPYEELGKRVGVGEEEALRLTRNLKDQKIIRQISAIFDTRSLGYKTSLVAMAIPKDRLEEAAGMINKHPGVSHNYRRNHYYNLWFTVAVPPDSKLGLEKTVDLLHQQARAEVTRMMPTLKLYKIGVNLDISGERAPDATDKPVYHEGKINKKDELTQAQITIIRSLQEDMPVVAEPYAPLAKELGVSLKELFALVTGFIARGQMRRISAVLHHRNAGFTANAMGVWAVPPGRLEEVGPIMGSFRAVSHCYQRPTYPDWPYSIFTMVHGKTAAECESFLEAIQAKTGITEYKSLYSTKEYKKTRVRYFTPETYAWEDEVLLSLRATEGSEATPLQNPRDCFVAQGAPRNDS